MTRSIVSADNKDADEDEMCQEESCSLVASDMMLMMMMIRMRMRDISGRRRTSRACWWPAAAYCHHQGAWRRLNCPATTSSSSSSSSSSTPSSSSSSSVWTSFADHDSWDVRDNWLDFFFRQHCLTRCNLQNHHTHLHHCYCILLFNKNVAILVASCVCLVASWFVAIQLPCGLLPPSSMDYSLSLLATPLGILLGLAWGLISFRPHHHTC